MDKGDVQLVVTIAAASAVVMAAVHWWLVGRVWSRLKTELEVLRLISENGRFKEAESELTTRLQNSLRYVLLKRRPLMRWIAYFATVGLFAVTVVPFLDRMDSRWRPVLLTVALLTGFATGELVARAKDARK